MPKLLIYLVAFVLACQSVLGKQDKPNILLIITDDQGYGDLSVHGNPQLETPHIDKLAGESVIFNRFYVSPVCAPSRASLLTGRYHLATGTTWVTHRMEVMREEEVTIAEMLQPAGYRTGLFGKWHQGKQYPHDPTGQGFDEFFGFTEGHLNNYFDATQTHGFEEVSTQGYLPDVLTQRTIEFMEKEEPFFAMLSFNTPHSPFQVPDRYFEKYKAKGLNDKDATVYGMVENIDENVGKVMGFLEQSGKLDQTLVIFMTDNGPNGERYNAGLKGIKGHLDEGGVRVPFFMRFPGSKPKIIEKWVSHIDILPTLAAWLEIPVQSEKEIHGRNLMPLIGSEDDWEDRYFFTHHVDRTFDTIPGAVRNHRYVLTLRENRKEFYDLLQDSMQENNIIQKHQDLASKFEKRYVQWLEKMTEEGVDPPSIQVGHENVPRIELPAPDGNRIGNVAFKGEMGWANDWFVGFQKPEDKVFWDLNIVENGSYEVFLQVANDQPLQLMVSLNGRSETVFLEDIYRAPLIANRDRVPRSEVEERIWPMVPLGTMEFEAGIDKITVGPVGNFDGNLELKSVILMKK